MGAALRQKKHELGRRESSTLSMRREVGNGRPPSATEDGPCLTPGSRGADNSPRPVTPHVPTPGTPLSALPSDGHESQRAPIDTESDVGHVSAPIPSATCDSSSSIPWMPSSALDELPGGSRNSRSAGIPLKDRSMTYRTGQGGEDKELGVLTVLS